MTTTDASSRGTPMTPLVTIATAAERLETTAVALRARCRRRARREGREVVARLGAGVVAYKFGANWRVRFSSTD